MSDSRITQALSSVKAALESIADADLAVTELLREDPAFSLEVRRLLARADKGFAPVAGQLAPVLTALRRADQIENSPVGVRP